MRSSIACSRCRRSKIKCINNGIGTTCRTCEHIGHDCTYPTPATGGGRRGDNTSGRSDGYAGGHAERRQRARKLHQAHSGVTPGHKDSPLPLSDALDSRVLTAQVWQELFDIFQIHYSADLPFLHPPSFLKPLRAATSQSQPGIANVAESPVRPPASTEFLLAFLALTARFHSKLVAHHSPPTDSMPSKPLAASEYYAAAANEHMASIWTDHRPHDIERIQAMLMLGLHEWGACRGAKAWLIIGVAIRSAQASGLQYEMDLDDEPNFVFMAPDCTLARSESDPVGKFSVNSRSSDDAFIQQEIRRRTFWSCYIMDRYLSCGKYRPQMLHASDLRIQLPASEKSFHFADKVRTLKLGEVDEESSSSSRAEVRHQRQISALLSTTGTPDRSAASSPRSFGMRDDTQKLRLEVGAEEGLVSRYIKMLEIFGRVMQWSCLGGRRNEKFPPWDKRSGFSTLLRECQEFKASLPRQHTLTHNNTEAHITMKTSTPYTLLHTVFLLCQIVLHREYVPFVPVRCTKPEGPLDAPTFPPEVVPQGYWEESARECFRSAREITNLIRTCQEWNVLVETPIVGFAIFTVAFVGIYSICFPHMDTEAYMHVRDDLVTKSEANKSRENKGSKAEPVAFATVGQMITRLFMANGWFRTLTTMYNYFQRITRDFKKNSQAFASSPAGESPQSTRHLSLREGGPGGGLDEFKAIERLINDFGSLVDQDVDMADAPRTQIRPLDAIYDDSNSGATVKSEDGNGKASHGTATPDLPKSEGGAWSAINTTPGAMSSQQSHNATLNSGQFRSYERYSAETSTQAPSVPPPSADSQQRRPHPHEYHSASTESRPSFSETSGSAGPPPSLTPPTAHSVAASSKSRPQSSPPYEQQQGHNHYHTANSSTYAMPAPPPPVLDQHSGLYGGTPSYQHANHQLHPMQPAAQLAPHQPSHVMTAQPMVAQHQFGDLPDMRHVPQDTHVPMPKASWQTEYTPTMRYGQDVAAFMYGDDITNVSQVSVNQYHHHLLREYYGPLDHEGFSYSLG